MQPPDTLQPHNVEAEEALLGSLLIDSQVIHDVATFLDEHDFFIERNGWIFAAIRDLAIKNIPADFVTLSDELERRGQLEGVGGPARLTMLITNTFTAYHGESYAKIVERTAVLRRLIDAAGKIARMAYEDQNAVDEVLDRAQQLVFDIGQNSQKSTFRPISAAMSEYIQLYDHYYNNPGELDGLKFDLAEIDTILNGVRKGDSLILGGRPGTGKTALATDIALRVAKRGDAVGIISLEMPETMLLQRVLANEASVDGNSLKQYRLNDEEIDRFMKADSLISNLPLFIDDTPTQTITSISMKARRLVRDHGLKLLIIDYLQLISPENAKGMRHEQISAISRGLKLMARELNLPILTLSQINRSVDTRNDKEPQLGDLSEGSGIEKDADVVIFLWLADEEAAPNITSMKIAKHRTGSTGRKELFFQKEYSRFRALEYQQLDY